MTAILEKLLNAADNHAEDTGEPDHAVGDLQDLLRCAWSLMTDEQRVELLESSEVEDLVMAGARGEFEAEDLIAELTAESTEGEPDDDCANGSQLEQLKAAFQLTPPDWAVIPVDDARNVDGTALEIHDGFGRTATVYGELDAENMATANFMALSHNLMPHLLAAVDVVRSNHVGNACAEELLAALDS